MLCILYNIKEGKFSRNMFNFGKTGFKSVSHHLFYLVLINIIQKQNKIMVYKDLEPILAE